ncbi:MAG: preprotein translocase subunit SecE [Turicibacter sp.]|nr:preprotein translocase subunit SecE [Turicibacter sp.]
MKEFFDNIGLELKKITWPTDKEMKLHSTQVFVFMLIFTLFFAAVDNIISFAIADEISDSYYEEIDYDAYDLDELLDEDDAADTDDVADEDDDEDED